VPGGEVPVDRRPGDLQGAGPADRVARRRRPLQRWRVRRRVRGRVQDVRRPGVAQLPQQRGEVAQG